MSPFLVMLLATAGPLLVGFFDLGDDDSSDEAPDEDQIAEDPADPVETVDLASFLEAARSMADNEEAVAASRGTDADELFETPDDVAVAHDASGGADTISGSNGADTLIGGDGGDTIEGGAGDDALFSDFNRQSRPEDGAPDVLFGQEGDDTLLLGSGDTGEGGAGADIFATGIDASGQVTITDFNVEEDAIAIETADPDSASVTGQEVDDGGLNVALSTGLTLRLQGIDTPLGEGAIQFVRAEALASA